MLSTNSIAILKGLFDSLPCLCSKLHCATWRYLQWDDSSVFCSGIGHLESFLKPFYINGVKYMNKYFTNMCSSNGWYLQWVFLWGDEFLNGYFSQVALFLCQSLNWWRRCSVYYRSCIFSRGNKIAKIQR